MTDKEQERNNNNGVKTRLLVQKFTKMDFPDLDAVLDDLTDGSYSQQLILPTLQDSVPEPVGLKS